MKQSTLDNFLCKSAASAETSHSSSSEYCATPAPCGPSSLIELLKGTSKASLPFHVYHKSYNYDARLGFESMHRIISAFRTNCCVLAAAPRLTQDAEKTPVRDILLDARQEYLVAIQKQALRVYAVKSLDLDGASEDIISLYSSNIQQQRQGREGMTHRTCFDFSTVMFSAESLDVVCGYKSPHVEIFDLECVDEEECYPAHSFSLLDMPAYRDHRWATDFPTALSLANISVSTAIAGISDGQTVLLDRRAPAPIACTRNTTQTPCLIGQPPSRPIESITSVTTWGGGRPHLLCGAKNGTLYLWDVRQTHLPLCAVKNKGEISAIHAQDPASVKVGSHRVGCGRVWMSTAHGYVAEYGVGSNCLEKLTEMYTADVVRSDATIHLPAPKVAVHSMGHLLLLPNVARNIVQLLQTPDGRRSGLNPLPRREHDTWGGRRGKWGVETEREEVQPSLPAPDALRCIELQQLGVQISAVRWLDRREEVVLGASDGRLVRLRSECGSDSD